MSLSRVCGSNLEAFEVIFFVCLWLLLGRAVPSFHGSGLCSLEMLP